MPEASSFEYAVLRVVPRVERGEFLNVGVVLFCKGRGFLEAAIEFDAARLAALEPGTDAALVRSHLDALARVCRGGEDGGPIGRLTQAERFRWLTAPRSTILQCSEVHEGVCESPAEALEHAMRTHVHRRGGAA